MLVVCMIQIRNKNTETDKKLTTQHAKIKFNEKMPNIIVAIMSLALEPQQEILTDLNIKKENF